MGMKKGAKNHKSTKVKMLIVVGIIISICTIIILQTVQTKKDINVMADNESGSESDILTDELSEASKIEIEKEKKEELKLLEEKKIREAIYKIIGEYESSYGISYYDINTGAEVAINEDKAFFAASTSKIELAMLVAEKIQGGKISRNKLITYKDEHYEDGAGVLMGDIKAGDSYEILKLVELMLKHSDNIATNMIFDVVYERDQYIEYITGIKLPEGRNMITSKHQKEMLKWLYENPNNNPIFDEIADMLKNTDFNDRLDKYIPEDIVAHKIGDYGEDIHDVGIVYEDKPYILCIYTNGEGEVGRENIALISKAIYDIKVEGLN